MTSTQTSDVLTSHTAFFSVALTKVRIEHLIKVHGLSHEAAARNVESGLHDRIHTQFDKARP